MKQYKLAGLILLVLGVLGYFTYNEKVSVNKEKTVIAKQYSISTDQVRTIGYYPCLRDKYGILTIYGQYYMLLNKQDKSFAFICDVKGVIHDVTNQ